MKTQILKRLIIMILPVVLIMAIRFSAGANTGNEDEINSFQERLRIAESYFGTNPEPVIPVSNVYKIYDTDYNLVYESANKQDQKLKCLLSKSDLVTETNNTHIYQLSR